MSKPTALSIGIQRGGLEIRQFMRQRESVVFTMLFPLILLAIFGSVFSNQIAEGVTFSQYFVAGMIASGLVNTGFQQLAIMIPMERDFGTLKRLRGTPMPEAYKSDHRERYKSVDSGGMTFAKKPNEYTGTLIRGIATMHKSNAVPVINQDQMEEISRMRRG